MRRSKNTDEGPELGSAKSWTSDMVGDGVKAGPGGTVAADHEKIIFTYVKQDKHVVCKYRRTSTGSRYYAKAFQQP